MRKWTRAARLKSLIGSRNSVVAGASTALVPPAPAPHIAELIARQEQLVDELLAATAAQREVLRELYLRATNDGGDGGVAETARNEPRSVRADVEVKILGGFEVYLDGQPVSPWPSHRAASLLAYLLLHAGGPVRREVLMEAFWPASSAKSARNNLNVTVYQLRRRLRVDDRPSNRGFVLFNAGAYRLDASLTWAVDVDDYHAWSDRGDRLREDGANAAAAIAYSRAKQLWRGPLLDGENTDDWCTTLSRHLHMKHNALLERLGFALLDSGAADEAVAVGEELVLADPCREAAHQLLMRAHAANGQTHLVAAQFERCAAVLRRELGAEPAGTTIQLHRVLRHAAQR